MGFGLMFCGYLSLFDLRLFPLELIGFYLILLGAKKLEGYNKYFVYTKYSVYSILGYSLYYTIAWSLDYFVYSKELFNNVLFVTIDSIVYYILLSVFHVFLYMALYNISKECGFNKGMGKILRNAYIGALYLILTIISLFIPEKQGYFKLLVFMSGILWYILNSILLYSCYMRIATQEIIDKENEKIAEYDKKNKMASINKIQKKKKKEKGTSYRIIDNAPKEKSTAYRIKSEKKSK